MVSFVWLDMVKLVIPNVTKILSAIQPTHLSIFHVLKNNSSLFKSPLNSTIINGVSYERLWNIQLIIRNKHMQRKVVGQKQNQLNIKSLKHETNSNELTKVQWGLTCLPYELRVHLQPCDSTREMFWSRYDFFFVWPIFRGRENSN